MNDNNPKLDFCRRFVRLKASPIRFDGRDYLTNVYRSDKKNLVIKASRQVEKSTLLANTIAYELCETPGITVLLVTPRQEQAWVFARTRLSPLIQQSPLIRRCLLGNSKRQHQITNMQFANGSQCHIRAAYHTADAVRGISADILLVDEVQDIAAGDLPVLQETLSHSAIGKTIITGTPKYIENILEAAFARSTAHEWIVTCPQCDIKNSLDENCLGPAGIVCRACHCPLSITSGHWVARNPDSTWGDGYHINHLLVPWLNYDDIMERYRTYDIGKFKNEVLGLSTTLGEHLVTRAELEACCSADVMARKLSDFQGASPQSVIAGIDWGGGARSRTVMAIGYMRRDYVFQIGAFFRFKADEDTNKLLDSVAQVCRDFKIQRIAADGGGNGHVLNRLLLDRLNHDYGMYAILYSAADQEPRQQGLLWKWVVGRSTSIGVLFARVKKRSIVFPRVEDCGSFLDEFACELATYDESNRTVRYTHPDNTHDDALHATNYALCLAIRQFNMCAQLTEY